MNLRNINKHKSVYLKITAALFSLTVLMNILSCFRQFCDWYTLHIYRHTAEIIGRITSPVPFAVGEIIMYAAMVSVILTVILSVLLIFLRKKEGFRRFTAVYLKSMLMALTVTLCVYTFNWIIPFRTTPLDADKPADRKYTTEELGILRNYIVENINRLCYETERDENTNPVPSSDITGHISAGMNELQKTFPSIGNYCPPGKNALCSPFLEWMWIGGFTYPYTMEIAVNRYTDQMYRPALEAHEMAHHMGFYRENEAEMIGYLACVNSDDRFVQYSGYSSIYYYVDSDYFDAVTAEYGNDDKYMDSVFPEPLYYLDRDYFLSLTYDLYDEEVSESFEEAFSEVSEEIADTGWEVQSEILQDAVYSEVVNLLLNYYDGILF